MVRNVFIPIRCLEGRQPLQAINPQGRPNVARPRGRYRPPDKAGAFWTMTAFRASGSMGCTFVLMATAARLVSAAQAFGGISRFSL
jgi:hypothetical protein